MGRAPFWHQSALRDDQGGSGNGLSPGLVTRWNFELLGRRDGPLSLSPFRAVAAWREIFLLPTNRIKSIIEERYAK